MADKKIVDLNKIRNKKIAKKILNLLKIPLLVFVVVAAVFLSARMLGNVAVSNVTDSLRFVGEAFRKGGGYPYSVDISRLKEVTSIGSSPLLIYGDESIVLNSSANEVFSLKLNSADSKVISRNGRALIYSNSSNNLVLQSRTEELGSVTENGAVVSAALAKNGYFATSHSTDEAQSVLTVYNNRFNSVFQWNCSQERIADISLSSNGKKVAVVAVGAENAEIYTRIIVFNTNSKEIITDLKYSGTLFLKISFTSSNRIIAVGDNRTVVIKSNGEAMDEMVYPEDSLSAVCVDDNGNTVVFYEEFGGAKTGMVRFSSSGKKTCSETLDGIPDCVTAYGGKIAVLNSSEITVYSLTGKATRTFETESHPSDIFGCSGEIYTVEGGAVCKY